MIRAIITGASGMVGGGVLLECLDSMAVESVLMVNRSPLGLSHPKLSEIVHDDFADLSAIHSKLSGCNALFFCSGVSAVGKNEEEYSKLTYDLTLGFGKSILQTNPGTSICYISGSCTDSSEHGRQMWARIKGKTENALLSLGFISAFMFRPGIIRPLRGVRAKSLWVNLAYKIFWPLFPILRVLWPNSYTTTVAIGRAMIAAAHGGYGKHHLENRDINSLARTVL